MVDLDDAERCGSLVNTVLILGPVHLYRNLLLWLVDLDIIAIRLKSRRNRLDAQFAIGN
jgi:hypothetical protein